MRSLRWIERWYPAYAIIGLLAAGFVPILLPLLVNGKASGAAQVGLTVAAVNLGGLSAPLWGALADRFRVHRLLFGAGLAVSALTLAAFPFTAGIVPWAGLAFLFGVATVGSATVANLFVVEAHPQPEWDERIGWLQTFYAVGQVGGLLLAGAVSRSAVLPGFEIAAGLGLLAMVWGLATARTPSGLPAVPAARPKAAWQGEWTLNFPQRISIAPLQVDLRKIGLALRSPFGVFLAAWTLAFTGSAAFFSLYPVLMLRVFAVQPDISSLAFAAAAGLGLLLYSPAGQWSRRAGANAVMRTGLFLRIGAFIGVLALGLSGVPGRGYLGLACFAVIVLAWSLISVSGTALAAALAPVGEGEAMGVFSAAAALAGVAGAVLGGWISGVWGYAALPAVSLVGISAGLVILSLGRRTPRATAPAMRLSGKEG